MSDRTEIKLSDYLAGFTLLTQLGDNDTLIIRTAEGKIARVKKADMTPLQWLTTAIDKDNSTYYYIQTKLEAENQYRIQRITKSDYSIGWNYSETNEWVNRETLTYE